MDFIYDEERVYAGPNFPLTVKSGGVSLDDQKEVLIQRKVASKDEERKSERLGNIFFKNFSPKTYF